MIDYKKIYNKAFLKIILPTSIYSMLVFGFLFYLTGWTSLLILAAFMLINSILNSVFIYRYLEKAKKSKNSRALIEEITSKGFFKLAGLFGILALPGIPLAFFPNSLMLALFGFSLIDFSWEKLLGPAEIVFFSNRYSDVFSIEKIAEARAKMELDN